VATQDDGVPHVQAAAGVQLGANQDRMTTEEIDQLPEGALLYQDKTSGQLIVTRNDAEEKAREAKWKFGRACSKFFGARHAKSRR
jgi:hypothetical protein